MTLPGQAGTVCACKTALNRMRYHSPLQSVHHLEHCTLYAVDGAIGTVEALYFDEVNWAVRYLLVDTGGWLNGRRVLISPVAVGEVRAEEQTIFIELTRAQIESSPPLDPDQPVSRRYEEAYYRHFDWPVYWEEDRVSARGRRKGILQEKHLQDTARVEGCLSVAADGAIGTVRDIFVDIRYWVIRYLEIETRGNRPGRHVLVSTGLDRAGELGGSHREYRSCLRSDRHGARFRCLQGHQSRLRGRAVQALWAAWLLAAGRWNELRVP